jgi:hypothetical protein
LAVRAVAVKEAVRAERATRATGANVGPRLTGMVPGIAAAVGTGSRVAKARAIIAELPRLAGRGTERDALPGRCIAYRPPLAGGTGLSARAARLRRHSRLARPNRIAAAVRAILASAVGDALPALLVAVRPGRATAAFFAAAAAVRAAPLPGAVRRTAQPGPVALVGRGEAALPLAAVPTASVVRARSIAHRAVDALSVLARLGLAHLVRAVIRALDRPGRAA